MCALKISFNQAEQAISVMREVSAWGREQGYRVWPDERLTEGGTDYPRCAAGKFLHRDD